MQIHQLEIAIFGYFFYMHAFKVNYFGYGYFKWFEFFCKYSIYANISYMYIFIMLIFISFEKKYINQMCSELEAVPFQQTARYMVYLN
jgi:hypothetical protein